MKLQDVPKGLTRTYTGILMNVMRPEPEMINIEDIAHALAQIPRWGGHAKQFYSVAQHSIFVSRLSHEDLALSALLHDASEAYLIDVPSPIKAMMPQYKSMEAKMMKVIFGVYNLPYPMPDYVKLSDELALKWEWEHLVIGKHPKNFAILNPENAKRAFLDEYEMLMSTVKKNNGKGSISILK